MKRVDMYDMGRTAAASVTIAGREQQLICDLPGASTGVIDKLVAKNVAIDVHQPETWMMNYRRHRGPSKYDIKRSTPRSCQREPRFERFLQDVCSTHCDT